MNILEIYNQEEFDKIPENFIGRIVIKFGTPYKKAIVNRSFRFASVEACGNSTVEARGNSSVVACHNSNILACHNSNIVAFDDSSVEAFDNSSVVAYVNSNIVAYGNSSVEACHNSSVVACGNSTVVACGNSSVVACGNAQIVNMQKTDKNLKISGNTRVVYLPKNIKQYCVFYGIDHTKTKGRFYKAVHKNGNRYFSDYHIRLIYEIGKTYKQNCDIDTSKECSYGLHIAFLQWALDFGKDWQDLAIIEVESKLSNIVVPKNSDGKIRTSELKVIREVPLSECGIYGKIIEKRLIKKDIDEALRKQ